MATKPPPKAATASSASSSGAGRSTFDNAEFWNPKIRAPICFNAPSARTVLPSYLERTRWILSGVSKADALERTKAALAAKKNKAPEPGAMSFMLAKGGYLGDDVGGHWHPHLMFYLPRTEPAQWGANLPGSPVSGDLDKVEPITIFYVPVGHWSDGTPAN